MLYPNQQPTITCTHPHHFPSIVTFRMSFRRTFWIFPHKWIYTSQSPNFPRTKVPRSQVPKSQAAFTRLYLKARFQKIELFSLWNSFYISTFVSIRPWCYWNVTNVLHTFYLSKNIIFSWCGTTGKKQDLKIFVVPKLGFQTQVHIQIVLI